MLNFFKKYHKWLGITATIFIIMFSLSGIVLNHRETFSFADVNRNNLFEEYRYKNWNNAAVKSTLKINNDSILIYGNIGIWLTDSTFNKFTDFNNGFNKGIDNKKICQMLINEEKELFAATFFGLYKYNFTDKKWINIELPVHEKRVVDLLQKQDTLFILMRSHLLYTTNNKDFNIRKLPPPENYDNKVGLFKTLWVIHSGEIYGEIGKLIVDLVGLIFIFLSITGLIYFINGFRIKKKQKLKKSLKKVKSINLWNLKWHNKIGWITLIILVITTATGMFLRPPLLIAIANSKVEKIPYTELDTDNPWFDILRRITFDKENDRFIIATMDNFYYSDDYFTSELTKFKTQPPASVMGVTVLKKTKPNTYLVGSFEGLYEWNTKTGDIFDYIKKIPYKKPKVAGPPIGEYNVTGFTEDFKNQEIFFDFNFGAANISKNNKFSKMPDNIINAAPMSLWNLALEIHTARFYKFMFGKLYILFIPISGIIMLFILISGFIVWWKLHRNNNKINIIEMETNKYRVNVECIGCRMCVEVADKNFEMDSNNLAFVKKQPENRIEEEQSQNAMEICPVNAILKNDIIQKSDIEPILAKSNIKETLDKYPKLKSVLIELSPKFKKMQNPALYNTLARFASFSDAAKVTGVSICEILHAMNKHLGVEEKLIKNMPGCITDRKDKDELIGEDITWEETTKRYIYDNNSLNKIIEKITKLPAQKNIVVFSTEKPNELLRLIKVFKYKFNIEHTREYRISIFNDREDKKVEWEHKKHKFEKLDVRKTDINPFDAINKKAKEIKEDEGFVLIQNFEPSPMIKKLSKEGFEHLSEKKLDNEFWVYFYKKIVT